MTHEDLFKIELAVSAAFKKSGMDSEELDLALYIFSNLRSTAYYLENGGLQKEAINEVMDIFK